MYVCTWKNHQFPSKKKTQLLIIGIEPAAPGIKSLAFNHYVIAAGPKINQIYKKGKIHIYGKTLIYNRYI